VQIINTGGDTMKNVKWMCLFFILLAFFSFAFFPGCSPEAEPDVDENESINNDNGSFNEASEKAKAESESPVETVDKEKDEPGEEGSGTFGWATFVSEEHGFSIDYPDTWIVMEPGSSSIVIFRPYEGTQTTIEVSYYKSNFADYTYDNYIGNLVDRTRRIRSDAEFGETQSLEINEHPFVMHEYNWTIEDLGDLGMYARGYYTANEYGFTIRQVIQEDELDELLPIVDQMLESFQFQ